MAVDGSRLDGTALTLAPRDPAIEQRARLTVADYARRTNPRAPRRRAAVCTELLDMLGLLEVRNGHD